MEIVRNTIKWVLCFASTTPDGKHDIIVCDSSDGLPLINLLMDISDLSWNSRNVFDSEWYDTLEDLLHSIGEVECEDNITADQESNEIAVAHDTSLRNS
ncbi:putative LRR containing protein [Trachipleistophora hominis]|uniref:Putative LRR containing protein n=1 Tax=Trachipleistophora hominis TaxID=72359 RepID=L7JWI9_TRAHO|nr:putative LRR containing protein [Trachipleistophora hominis]